MSMRSLLFYLLFALPGQALASSAVGVGELLDLTQSTAGYIAIIIFSLAYILVIFEEKLHLRKSKPVLIAAGLIWILIALVYRQADHSAIIEAGIRHNFLEYAELFFFLLVAMTYINAMLERGVFDALRDWLVQRGLSYRGLFWLTGVLAFFISPIADNLTTALVMCAVLMAVGQDKPKFVALGCVNIVVAANAGGAFSPFGDITTLMVWQKGIIAFEEFFVLFIPSAINFLIPATLISLAIPSGRPDVVLTEHSALKTGGLAIVGLFLLTIVTAISFHSVLHIPPVFGMMTGLGYLKLYGFYLKQQSRNQWTTSTEAPPGSQDNPHEFDIFKKIAQAEWDTLFFFYGVILAVGGLGFMGYLALVSEFLYGQFGVTSANVLVGILSAVVDNIPVMFAVLTMNPEMDHSQWLLVTLTAGVGGSLLSIGSAAGVALMGQARGYYTFFGHLKWMPAIAFGYAASIGAHLWLNG